MLMKFSEKIEFVMANKKPQRCGFTYTIKGYKQFQRFTIQKLTLLLKWDKRWWSSSNTFKDIQLHLSVVIFRIYNRCQAAIPIIDILIDFGATVIRLNPYVKNFRFLGSFSTLLTPKDQNSNFWLDDLYWSRFLSFRENFVEIDRAKNFCWKIKRINRSKMKLSALPWPNYIRNCILKSYIYLKCSIVHYISLLLSVI